jgi:hypothetical protein
VWEKKIIMYFRVQFISIVLCLGVVLGCSVEKGGGKVFSEVSSSQSGINFSNDLSGTKKFNQFTYRNFYAGGGVALGDVNGDGLTDVYLTANQKSNKLYLNRGDFEFEDVTDEAGVGGERPWSTGVSMADVNGDGYIDIYVTNSGQFEKDKRKNELFINQGDGTFVERAEAFGVADAGNSIHAAFFDYDRDGDLDLFVLNNYASKPIEDYDLSRNLRDTDHFRGGDRLYRNDSGEFTEVTQEAGIYSSEIGFGLGVSVGDVNRDGWMDIYVSNDFFERDYLYINNGDGTFSDEIHQLDGTSSTSMGGDIADLNQDGFPEIYSTDMLPRSEKRLKTVADFVSWERFQELEEMGYYRTYARNMLHYNNENGSYNEIGRYARVESTAWSWGALMADFNLDGEREIFVANGFYKDVTNKDVMLRLQDEEVRRSIFRGGQIDYEKLLEITPSVPLSNYLFENVGDMRFENRAKEWGIGEENFSNGSAYGDLDNDGDLDLVVNNVNDKPFVYRNRTVEQSPDRRWLRVSLKGMPPNTLGVGAQVELIADGRRWYVEQMPQRGFQSSVDPVLHVGLGNGIPSIDTMVVRWPDGRTSRRTEVSTNQEIEVHQSEVPAPAEKTSEEKAGGRIFEGMKRDSLLVEVSEELGLTWNHEESAYSDFEQAPLLFHMRSTEGPPLCTADVTGDGLTDVYVGGGRGQSGALFVQRSGGRFERTSQPGLEADRESEDTDCAFLDADGEGPLELYVASGSSEFPAGSPELADRLYRVRSGGVLERSGALPVPEGGKRPTGTVAVGDADGDGAPDLFVGTRMRPSSDEEPQEYGSPVGGRLLMNDGTGTFTDATAERAPQLHARNLRTAGVTDAEWGDLNGDGRSDLVVVGEWMPVTVFFGREDRLVRAPPDSVGLEGTSGWWQSLTLADLDRDGALDFVGGNHGLNSRFEASPAHPVQMWAGDFNRNGALDHIIARERDGKGPYPVALYQNLVERLPYLKSEYSTFGDYAETTVPELFSEKQLESADHYHAEQMASVVAWNDGNGRFHVDSLPFQAQLAPMYGSLVADLKTGGEPEILMGGNLRAVKPQMGSYDASTGVLLSQNGGRRRWENFSEENGFFAVGEVRDIETISVNGKLVVLVARNDSSLQAFRSVQ